MKQPEKEHLARKTKNGVTFCSLTKDGSPSLLEDLTCSRVFQGERSQAGMGILTRPQLNAVLEFVPGKENVAFMGL